ncbi:MAG: ligase-associated DNA damage response DEXH box helicase [Desulfobacterales bacterium]|jgi:ATP-dependent Lhr-like helicase
MSEPQPALAKQFRPAFGQVMRWFRSQNWQPFDFQIQAWQAYLQGHSGLIHAPTGIGKTYAAFMGPVIAALTERHKSHKAKGRLEGKQEEMRPLKVLWLTPLRALAADIGLALRKPIAYFELDWKVQTRTGDTPASVRARQQRRLPTVLITTPESLSLLLSYPGAQPKFNSLSTIIVDEWHELMGSKRGVLAQLAMARLQGWCPQLRIWGLSATLGNTHTAMQVLLGHRAALGRKIQGLVPKDIAVESIVPEHIERFPWAGHLGTRLLPQVVETIAEAGSTLVFTNTRSQTETWYQAILEARPDWAGRMALHHGSLDKKKRQFVEGQLLQGQLKCVVCTSSLDLGVDFLPVDRVIQIGSPKGIARLMQRAGRSGHQPGECSRVTCVPTNTLELVEIAAARQAIAEGNIELRYPVINPLDVLSQHLITMAAGDGFSARNIYREIKTTHAFSQLTRHQFEQVLDFVTSGGPTLKAYPEYSRLIRINGSYQVRTREILKRHRMNIGTITSDAAMAVKYRNGRRLGSIEESFASRLKKGDHFIFAGHRLEFIKVKDMTVLVKKAGSLKGPVPQWMGGRMPLSSQLAYAVQQQLKRADRKRCGTIELTAVKPLLDLQARWSLLPDETTLLIERLKSRDGFHLFIYPFEGYLTHEGLAALLAYRLSKLKPLTISMAVNDYGFELLSDDIIPLQQSNVKSLLASDNLLEDILQSVNVSEMARRQFREIARIAGLVFQGYPGRPKKSSQIQASSSLIFNVFKRYDPDNFLVAQANREVLENQLEKQRLTATLDKMSQCCVRIVDVRHPTPLAFPIMVNRLRAKVSTEKLVDRVRKMQLRLESVADRAT